MRKMFLLLSISFILSACAASQPLIKPTSSGYPEGIFRNTSIDRISSKIMDGCTSNGLIIYEATSNQVVCGKTMSGMDAVLGQLVVGNSYSTTPERKVRFSIFQQGNDVKVVAHEWMESQMAFGQIRRQPFDANHQKNSLQQFLFSLGAE